MSKKDKLLHANPPETDVLAEGDRVVALARTSARPTLGLVSRQRCLLAHCHDHFHAVLYAKEPAMSASPVAFLSYYVA